MRNLGKIVAHIPARGGSKRVKAKNLRMLCGKPLLQYSIDSAKKVKVFDAVYVNSDSEDMLALAEQLGVNSYKRSTELASDTATGDQFTADFIENIAPDTLVMISPVCPMITEEDISAAIEAFKNSDCDTLITCDRTQMQTFCEDVPVNICVDEQLAPTQKNPQINILNWAVTIWDAKKFIQKYRETGSAYIGKKRLLYPINPVRGLKISHESDFNMAECLLYGLSQIEKCNSEVKYWSKCKPS